MTDKRNWKLADRILSIEWGKLSGDVPASRSARQREADAKRIAPYYITVTDYPDCDWCGDTIPPVSHNQEHRGLCPLCEIEEGE